MTPPDTARQSALEEGRRVLRVEATALAAMAEDMPEAFAAAIETIRACRGRVVVSGIGKSGHVGRKIAATLASTGTPAQFVHAAEASHGDLGMVTREDLCLLISNSGETAELRDLIAHTRRFSIPLVAICARPDSALARAADVALILPDVPEACAIGLTPTTSTTLTLALGDALAVSLMTGRGFRAEEFHAFHPGGKLGMRLRRVADLMHGPGELPLVATGAPMADVLLTMTSRGYGIAVVTEDGSAGAPVAGVITDGDLRRNMADLMTHRAGDIANPRPVTATPDMLAARALALMNERKIAVLVVTDPAGAPVGILHLHDCLRAGVA